MDILQENGFCSYSGTISRKKDRPTLFFFFSLFFNCNGGVAKKIELLWVFSSFFFFFKWSGMQLCLAGGNVVLRIKEELS